MDDIGAFFVCKCHGTDGGNHGDARDNSQKRPRFTAQPLSEKTLLLTLYMMIYRAKHEWGSLAPIVIPDVVGGGAGGGVVFLHPTTAGGLTVMDAQRFCYHLHTLDVYEYKLGDDICLFHCRICFYI